MTSLRIRLIKAATLVLAAFLGLTGITLENVFRRTAEAALQDRLQGQIYALLAAADFGRDGRVTLPGSLPEARFSVPWSGLYAQVSGDADEIIWQSDAQKQVKVGFHKTPGPGELLVEKTRAFDGTPVLSLSFSVLWQDGERNLLRHTFSVAESLAVVEREVAVFRQNLWLGLLAVAALLILTLAAILKWVLRPLDRVTEDLARIENGSAQRLEGEYPRELQPLTGNLNALIAQERSRSDRYRDALGDLAHSLKTPLAMLRNTLATQGAERTAIRDSQDQLERMTQSIDYHLQRAATRGRVALGPPVVVADPINRVINTLRKVYQDKGIDCVVEAESTLRFPGEEGDLLELLGMLLDNAFKWAAGRVQVTALALEGSPRIRLVVEDDGPGIDPAEEQRILRRGYRGDEAVGGHGIGLAVASEIVSVYNGVLRFEQSGLGGARVVVEL